MIEALESLGLTNIVIIILILLFGIKELLELIDFFKGRNKQAFQSVQEEEEIKQLIKDTAGKLTDIQKHFDGVVEEHNKTLKMLVASDRDDIKGYITEKFHYFTELGYIDDFSMEVLERRFEHYIAEGGNSFIEAMMNQLRALPRK
jgi:hypothetical protein